MSYFSKVSRRGLLAAGAGLAAASVVGCSSSTATTGTSSGGTTAGKASMWGLSGKPNEQILTDCVTAFNKLGKGSIDVTFFQNDAYKQKIRTAVGAGEAPTMIYGWGGGILKGYADAGQVLDLTDWVKGQAAWKAKYFDSPWGASTIGGKIFGVPTNNTQPIVMYYNKKLFDQVGASLPKTWDDVMNLVGVFNGKGIAPFSLGGGSKWTSMMWLEYMFDRIGGPEVFNNIYAGKKGAWGDDSALKAYKMIQELVDANGFIKGFMSVTADSNADQALLYTGKAAMMLHGGWAYGGMKSAQADFVAKDLAFGAFPSISGGKGDAKAIVGNPANYWSISAKASEAEQMTAKNWLLDGQFTDTVVDAFIASGGVPVQKSAEAKLGSSPNKDFLTFIYSLVTSAPNFQQSWDQALSATQAEALLNNISQLFSKQIGPDQFATNMNATL